VVSESFAISDDGIVTDPLSVASPKSVVPHPVVPPPPSTRLIVLALSGLVTALLIALLTVLPLPYLIDRPGPTFDMFDDSEGAALLSIDGVTTYAPSGELRLTTVAVQGGPEHSLPFGTILRAWLSPNAMVQPEYSGTEGGSTQQQWVTSQEMAMVAALSHQDIEVPAEVTIVGIEPESNAQRFFEYGDVIVAVNGSTIDTYDDLDAAFDPLDPGDSVTVTVLRAGREVSVSFATIDNGLGRAVMGVWVDPTFNFPFDIGVAIDNVGGPSGGALFALGIIDLLTPEDELDGEKVAGTGTIDLEGNVGPIGGIVMKIEGAARAGSRWFLAPALNCPSVQGNIPDGMTVVAVSTLDEAYAAMVAIGAGDTASLPSCT